MQRPFRTWAASLPRRLVIGLAGLAALTIGAYVVWGGSQRSGEGVDGLLTPADPNLHFEGAGTTRPLAIGETVVISFSSLDSEEPDIAVERVEVLGLTDNAELVGSWTFDVSRLGYIKGVNPPDHTLIRLEDFRTDRPHRIAIGIKKTAPGDVTSEALRVHYRVGNRRGSTDLPFRVTLAPTMQRQTE